MHKLEAPNVTINFKPSPKQLELWNALQPNRCDKCGGKLEMRPNGFDEKTGMQIFEPTCVKCGNTDIPEIILGGGSAGGGKQTLLDSEVCTPFGFRKLRDLKKGSIITNPKTGGMQKIIQLHPIEKHPYYRIHFVDGTHTDCSEGHLWECHESRKKLKRAKNNDISTNKVWETLEMYRWYQRKKEGLYKGMHLIIPLTEPVKFTIGCHKPEIDPYILGALIGDGSIVNNFIQSGAVQFTTMDDEIKERFIAAGYDMSHSKNKPNNRSTSYYIKDANLIKALKKLGVAGNRSQNHFIPKEYKMASIEERIALMQGLIDTDGYVDSRGHIVYTSTSKMLAEDVAFIVRSLGGVATVTQHHSGYKNEFGEFVQCSDHYDVQIRTKMNPDLCGITRKKERARYEYNGGFSELGKRIEDIEYIGIREGRCITVDDPSGLYVIDNFTVTHNSYLGSSWLVLSCMMFDNLLMVVARKNKNILKTSTWLTIKKVLREWGLKEDVHWHENGADGYIDFWNGSRIMMLGLEFVPSDPEYTWLGSIEISGAFIDEVSEIPEKAVEVLASRIRHRTAETFVVGKTFMSTNPCAGWVRSTFVMDDDENPVVLQKGYRYIPFSLFDNPNQSFVAVYYNKLKKIRDKKTRNRLLYGDWREYTDNKAAAYWNYSHDKHRINNLWQQKYDPTKPLILAVDFNVIPYMTCEVSQIDYANKKAYFLRELIGYPQDKRNNTPAFSRWVAQQILSWSHTGGIILTGDPAGLARSTQTEDGVNNFTIFRKNLQEAGIIANIQLLTKQPAQITRIEFINELLAGHNGWEILMEYKNNRLVDDMVYQKKEPDGTKQKKKVTLPSGDKAEQYGHASDCFDYTLIYFLNDEYEKYRKLHDVPIVVTINSDATMYNEFEY